MDNSDACALSRVELGISMEVDEVVVAEELAAVQAQHRAAEEHVAELTSATEAHSRCPRAQHDPSVAARWRISLYSGLPPTCLESVQREP